MNNEKRLFRDYKHFNKEAFLSDLQSVDWNIIMRILMTKQQM